MTDPFYYTGLPLDRAAHRRRDDTWLAKARAHDGAIWIPVHARGNLLAAEDAEANRILNWTTAQAAPWLEAGAETVFLGLYGDRPCWAVDCNGGSIETAEAQIPGSRFVDIRRLAAQLPRDDAGLAAYARAMVHWHLNHRFCGVCGGETSLTEAGHARKCNNDSCGRGHFPRTDPAVIVLVHARIDGEDKCLLGHNKNFPDTLYSTLAGFVEPGESPEETVSREIFEEAGVRVARCRYIAAQPWPFPASLMIGYLAEAATTDITLEPDELADARWFSRKDLKNRKALGINLPMRHAIARHLIEMWRNGETT